MTVAGALTNSVTNLVINDQTANIYGDKTFAATNVALVDGNNIFTNVLTLSGTPLTNQLVQNLPVSANLSYDLNGNLTSDGLHGYEYDCANQLTRIVTTNKFKSEFVYDGFGRRRIRKEYAWTGSWVPTSETRYIYDGMLAIQERDGNNTVQVSYTRGLDLSGGFAGAGGIGGLLARTDANGSAFYHSDGGGNITALINSSGTVLAKYLYDPYGNLLNKSGPLADANLYRFSSKEAHVPSGTYYYGYRYYAPNLQRWINRDPMAEAGGANLYRFINNDPMQNVDAFGLLTADRFEEIVAEHDYYLGGPWYENESDWLEKNPDAPRPYWYHSFPSYDDSIYHMSDDPDPVRRARINALTELGMIIDGFTPAVLYGFARSPEEPYCRRKFYPNTPTKADRAAFGAGPDQVVNHEPPLVKRYWWGDPSRGEKPGYQMTPEERAASAADRSRMNLQSKSDSYRQAADMSKFSQEMNRGYMIKPVP